MVSDVMVFVICNWPICYSPSADSSDSEVGKKSSLGKKKALLPTIIFMKVNCHVAFMRFQNLDLESRIQNPKIDSSK